MPATATPAPTQEVTMLTTTTATFANGETREVNPLDGLTLLGLDADGDLVVKYDCHGFAMVYALTPCCQASGKGGGHGVICRACYADVDYKFGGEAVVAVEVTA